MAVPTVTRAELLTDAFSTILGPGSHPVAQRMSEVILLYAGSHVTEVVLSPASPAGPGFFYMAATEIAAAVQAAASALWAALTSEMLAYTGGGLALSLNLFQVGGLAAIVIILARALHIMFRAIWQNGNGAEIEVEFRQ